MGQGPSIQELAEKEKSFREYLAQIRGEIEKDKATDIKNLDIEVKNFYKEGKWDDYKPLMALDNVEVQQISTWSLDNVVKILNSVKDAIFGSATPPPGVTIEKPASFTKSLLELSDMHLLVLSRSFEAIQGILQTFATESSYRGKSITRHEQVAPGMTVFISIRSDVWKNKGFFNNDSIAQYLFIVKSYFSIKQAGDIAKFNTLGAYQDVMAAYVTRIGAVVAKIEDPATPYSALTELEQELGHYSAQLGKFQAMIDQLSTKQIADWKARARLAIENRIKLLKKDG